MPYIQKDIRQAVILVTPQMTGFKKGLLVLGQGLSVGFLLFRRIRLLKRKENAIPFALGSVLDHTLGKKATVQQIARFVFGGVSIIRCSEDFLEMRKIFICFKALLRGEEYITIHGNGWKAAKSLRISPSWKEKWLRYKILFPLFFKKFFQYIGQFFKRFAALMIHLTDAYLAYRQKTVNEVFIHGKDLWKKLTSDEAVLVKHLKSAKRVNNFMLGQLNPSWTTSLLLSFLTVPAKLKGQLPDKTERKRRLKEPLLRFEGNLAASKDTFKTNYLNFIEKVGLLPRLNEKLIPAREVATEQFIEGFNDPDTLRFIKSPKR